MKKIYLLLFILSAPFLLLAQAPTRLIKAHYKFNGDATDATYQKNHGELVGPVSVPNRALLQNSAYKFNGIDNYIRVPNSQSLTGIYQFLTLSAWVKIDTFSKAKDGSDCAIIVSKSWNKDTVQFEWMLVPDGMIITNNGFTGRIVIPGGIPTNTWFHVGISVVQENATAYYNGKKAGDLVLAVTNERPIDTTNLYIGTSIDSSYGFFKGYLDDLRIYGWNFDEVNMALIYKATDNELESVYKDLLLYLPFNTDTKDYSGYGNNTFFQNTSYVYDHINAYNSALDFNGTTSYGLVPNTECMMSSDSTLTITGWLKIKNFKKNSLDNQDYATVLYKGVNATSPHYGLSFMRNGLMGLNYGYTGVLALSESTPVNQWFHFAVTFKDSLMTYYKNGKLVSSILLPTKLLASKFNSLYIGRDFAGATYLDGSLHELTIHSKVLNENDIARLSYKNLMNELDEFETLSKRKSIYPNPASTYVVLSENYPVDYVLYDISGRKLAEGTEFELDCRNYQNGSYLIQITDQGHTFFQRLLIEK
ncbi:MAG: T9SS type A sorting domain-containing protein [Bacteroidia bacterium]|nr:T9SS type A sorting domain-containing protein [Bacteroidia bacterium]